MKVVNAVTGEVVARSTGKDPRTIEHQRVLAEECEVTRRKAMGRSLSGVSTGRHARKGRGKHRA